MVSRRAFLRGLASSAFSLPLLPSLDALAQEQVATRFIVWFQPNGHHPLAYPTSLDFTGTAFEPLQSFSDQMIVTRGLSMKTIELQDPDSHPLHYAHMLTGVPAERQSENVRLPTGPSIDHVIAQRLSTRALRLGIDPRWTMTWGDVLPGAETATPLAPQGDPGAAFDELFGGFTPPETQPDPVAAAEAARQQRMRRSILDAVAESYESLATRLSTADRARLELHREHIRSLELQASQAGVAAAGLGCTQDGIELTAQQADAAAASGHTGDVARAQMGLMVKALECGLTRVGTLQWFAHSGAFGQPYDAWQSSYNDGGSWDIGAGESHHATSHTAHHDRFDRLFARELAHLLGLLRDATAEDGSSLLDHTVVLCVSELGVNGDTSPADHQVFNLSFSLCGGAELLRTGQYIDFNCAAHDCSATTYQGFEPNPFHRAAWTNEFKPSDIGHNRLYVELINALTPGAPAVDFGAQGYGVGGLPEIRRA